MSARSRSSSTRALLALITLIASLVVSALPANAVTVTGGVLGGFEQDGDQLFDGDPGATLDWSTVSFAPGSPAAIVVDDTLDSGFTEGSKELQPAGWACGNGGADPGKADILRAFANPRVSADKIYIDLAFIRKTADDTGGNGDVHVNFEFNQVGATPAACPLDRQEGDLLVTYDFPGGSSLPGIRAWLWDDGAGKGQDEGDWVDTGLLATQAMGAVNPGPMEDKISNGVPALGMLGPQQFGEATLDLTQVLAPKPGGPACVSFGSLNVRSRSSGESWTSSLQDKLPSTPIDFSTCAEIKLVKKGDGGELLAGAKFELYLDANKNNVLDDPKIADCTSDTSGECSWDLLSPGVYFVKETEAPAGYSLDDDPVVGPITLVAHATVTIDGLTNVDGVAGLDGFENYKWRYSLTLSPDASNLVGTDHVFTATLTVQKTDGGPYVAAASETLGLSLTGLGTIVSPGATCVTDDNGQCDITIHSDAAGDSTLAASFDDKVTTVTVDASDSAVKHWINYSIDIAPDATNLVGTAHTFTVTVMRDSGSGLAALAGAKPTIQIVSGPGAFSDNTCATTGTNSLGQCTIKLTSAVIGTTVVKALYEAVEETTSNTFSDTATKNWVDYRLVVNPDGVNHAGAPHTFTVVLEQRIDGAWVGLDGEDIALTWTGTGSILPAASCETDAAGECEVVASSDVTGSGTLTAAWGKLLHSGQLDLDDSADKTWIDWDISIAPDDKTNLVGTDHNFTVTVRFDAGDGEGLQPLADATPDIAIAGVGSVKDTDCDEGTADDGTCTVTITSGAAGDSTVTASWHAVDAESQVSEDLSAAADKHWVDYRIIVEQDAVNHVGDDHVFTVTVSADSGDGLAPLAAADVNLAWSGGSGSSILGAVPAGPSAGTSCTTDDAGRCLVTVRSDTPLTGTLTATYVTELDSGTHSFSADADKRWVNWALSITPAQAENLVGTNHTFVVKVTHDGGQGGGMLPLAGAKPSISLAGKGSIESNTCVDGTDAAGVCTVTITSSDPGQSTVTAGFQAAIDQASVNLSADGQKLWVDYRLVVSPKEAVNPVNTTHTFTVTLEKDTGNGFAPAASEEIDLGLSGPGSIINVDAGLISSLLGGICTTDAAGTCRVTITSPVAGLATLEATFGATVGETSRTFTDDGDKLWEVPVVVLGAVEELPRTGSPLTERARLALTLMIVGLALHLLGRRRNDVLTGS